MQSSLHRKKGGAAMVVRACGSGRLHPLCVESGWTLVSRSSVTVTATLAVVDVTGMRAPEQL